MPLKNYTTRVPANQSIEEIQHALVRHGALGILFEYEFGTSRVLSLVFKLRLDDKGGTMAFSLPANWRAYQAVLRQQRVPKWRDEEYVYRVAWRCVRDWVLAQLALHETRMVELAQVFFPFATAGQGRTVYQALRAGQLQIPDTTA
jgi:hypothetical protein